ncbi:phasin family protein [Novosphingobium sp. ZN18A2]|uniref:phasin family protein n=1 Tax=Novosphingobium sp. ZN18A2 TaxID=3079861 RepID=UPI0030CCC93C
MSTETDKADAAAEKAYAEASAKVDVKSAEAKPVELEAVETKAVEAAPVEAPSVKTKAEAPASKPAKAKTAKAVKPVRAKTAPKAAKPAAKAAPAPRKAKKAAPAPAKPAAAKAAAKPKVVPKKTKPAAPAKPASSKGTSIMTTTTEFTAKFEESMKDMQERAKTLFEKGQTAFSDVPEFAKGNVEAMVESTKILAAGLQDMGKSYVEESKSAFETMTADAKDLAAVKSPNEFFEKQTALARKNFDAAVAATSKNSEAMLKLVNEAFQPLSTRVSLAVEKMKKAA